MKKRGFTLVEMLAVVIIMGLILIVVIPQIQNQLANRKKAIHETTLEMIYDATEDFTSSDPSTFLRIYNDEENRSIYCISLQELVDAGKLEAPIKNFSTGEELDLNYKVQVVTNSYREFEYELKESATCDFTIEPLQVYYDPTLPENGDTYPVLYQGMIPVIYEGGYWRKASMYQVWYNYATGKGMWANAVTVNPKASTCKSTDTCVDDYDHPHNREYYIDKAPVGTIIDNDDINGMYVWIPRFEYKINGTYGDGEGYATSAGSPGLIDVKFIAKSTTTPSDGYTIHPAFTFGGRNLGGMWVAKFEASANPESYCGQNSDAANCNKSKETKKGEPKLYVTVTPNRESWKYVSIGNAYKAVLDMNTNTTIYGMTSSDNRKQLAVNTHLMKNTEWSAVAYLSQSKYGKYGKDKKEIFPNMYYSNKTLTGCTIGKLGNNLSIPGLCKNTDGENASYNTTNSSSGTTSGTIYGIYDMAGGAWEYVMGNFNRNEASGDIILNDRFKEEEDEEGNIIKTQTHYKINDAYVNIYTTTTCANNECKGSAMNETKNWWLDSYDFSVTDLDSWLIRGGSGELKSQEIGIFALGRASGAASAAIGFRPVIVGTVK